jgi:hypothetical protein
MLCRQPSPDWSFRCLVTANRTQNNRYHDLNVASGLSAIKAATLVKLKLINTAVRDWTLEDAFKEIYANWYVYRYSIILHGLLVS